jgi:hypothetical protein
MGSFPQNHLPCLYLTDDDWEIENLYEDFLLDDVLYLRDKVYPDLASQTLALVEKRMGYLPRKSLTTFYEPNLRLYYHRYMSGRCCADELYYRTDELLKHMRTEDLKPDHSLFNNPETCQQLSQYYQPYLPQAYDRISKFLADEPNQEHSIAAVIWLGQILARGNIQLPDHLTPYDYRAITSIRYREMLMVEGEEAANNSSLLALETL